MRIKAPCIGGTSSNSAPLRDRLAFVWLTIAFLLLVFANGVYSVPIAAWLGPVLMVRFLRGQKVVAGLSLGYLINAVAFYFAWNPAFKDAGAMFALYTAAFGLLAFMPYVVDRLLSPWIRGFLATLVLPAAWVVVEYLLHLVFPLGTFFSIAYTQAQNLPLLQIMSVTGIWGVTFLVLWFAGFANYVWENGFDLGQTARGAVIYAIVMGTVLFCGGLRLALHPPAGETVKAAVLVTNVDNEVIPEDTSVLHKRLMDGTLTPVDRLRLSRTMAKINEDLLARSREQARAGARIINWTEYNAHVFKEDERVFLERCRRLARECQVYLTFPLITIETNPALRPAPAKLIENKSVMITPGGEIAYQYAKANLLIGWEMEHAMPGIKRIRSLDTAYGRLASVICLDMDFPGFMRQAGRQRVDIVLSGGVDGSGSSRGLPLHSVMATYRAIENGFSLARGGNSAQSIAVDYLGRFLGNDYYSTSDRTMVVNLPVRGCRTLYTALGNYFPWLCMLGLIGVIVAGVVRTVAQVRHISMLLRIAGRIRGCSILSLKRE